MLQDHFGTALKLKLAAELVETRAGHRLVGQIVSILYRST